MKNFNNLITQVRTVAKKAGVKKSNIQKIIKKVRKEKIEYNSSTKIIGSGKTK